MTPVRIRAVDGAGDKDGALLRWLQLEALPDDVPLETNEGDWWVAFEGSQPVAFAGLTASQQFPATGYLCRAGVIPSHRGRGLQRKLIQARERRAKKLGWTTMVTDTYANPASSNNLIRAGYLMHTPAVAYGFDGACYWKKSLK